MNRHVSGVAMKLSELVEHLESAQNKAALALSALEMLARRADPEASAERIADIMVEHISAALIEIEEGREPPDGFIEMFELRLGRMLLARHSCGSCDACVAMKRQIEAS